MAPTHLAEKGNVVFGFGFVAKPGVFYGLVLVFPADDDDSSSRSGSGRAAPRLRRRRRMPGELCRAGLGDAPGRPLTRPKQLRSRRKVGCLSWPVPPHHRPDRGLAGRGMLCRGKVAVICTTRLHMSHILHRRHPLPSWPACPKINTRPWCSYCRPGFYRSLNYTAHSCNYSDPLVAECDLTSAGTSASCCSVSPAPNRAA